MERDVIIIIISGLFCLIAPLYMLLYPQKWINYPLSIRLLVAGFPVLLFAFICDRLIKSHFDIATIIISGLGCLTGLIYMFLYPHKWTDTYGSIRILLIGFLFLSITTTINSLLDGHWDLNHIISFLMHKEVGRWLFRVLASFGYVFIIWGAVGMLVIKFVRR